MAEKSVRPFGLYIRLLAVGGATALALVVGLWLGEWSAPKEEQAAGEKPPSLAQNASSLVQPPDEPPLYFSLTIPEGAAQTTAAGEVAMAAAAGIHQYVVAAPLPWDGDMNVFLRPLELLVSVDPGAVVLVAVKLDPPAAWLAAHPGEAVTVPGKEPGYASLASEAWRSDAHTALEALVTALNTSFAPRHVRGYVLGCQEAGCWHIPDARDTSAANTAGFQRWLKGRYNDAAALQRAWADTEVSFETAAVPERTAAVPERAGAGPGPVFAALPDMQREVDFCRYTSEHTASIIAEFGGYIRKTAGKDVRIIVNYGFTYELPHNDAGHFALARLFDTDIDGFASPVSYYDRGLGGAGGMMGPVESAVAHGKQWFLIDDTRTGIARDPSTGEITRPKNVRADDVYSVQQRNFAAAVTHGLGLFWSDPAGDGWLHDPDMWAHFARMQELYRQTPTWKDGGTARGGPSGGLALVVDEESRFYLPGDGKFIEALLNQTRDHALRVAAPVRHVLLADVIAGKVPPAAVYLFLNAFHIPAADRARLHGVLESNQAAAVWLYAPGYIDETASAENISLTTRMKVKALDGAGKAGSVYQLSGDWLGKDQPIGVPVELQPLFYIDDPEPDIVARYAASGKASVGVRFFPEGWASVYCADPFLTGPLLRELLALLEIHCYYQPTPIRFYDAFYSGFGLIGIHARESGERILELDTVSDVQDLLAPEVGWQRKRVINLPLKTGDTRLLKVLPLEPALP